jgi:Protein of unknown function (DUF2510)
VSQAEDLERLARLLDEGKLTQEEFESAKRTLFGSGDGATQTQSPAGWYKDPSGVAAHEAYWDGERWTGATRPDPNAAPATKRSGCLTALIVGVALVLVFTVVAVLAVVTAGNEVSETFSELGSVLDEESASTTVRSTPTAQPGTSATQVTEPTTADDSARDRFAELLAQYLSRNGFTLPFDSAVPFADDYCAIYSESGESAADNAAIDSATDADDLVVKAAIGAAAIDSGYCAALDN